MLDTVEITPLVIDPLDDSDPAFIVAVPSLNVALEMVPDVLRDPDLIVAVPSLNVAPNTWPNAKMLDAEDITPLVIDPLVLNDPAFNVAVPSVNVDPNT